MNGNQAILRASYSSWIIFYDLSLVSMTNLRLKAKDTAHQAPKKMKRIAGLPSRTLSVRMGNKMMISEAQIQLVAVEKGTILGCTT